MAAAMITFGLGGTALAFHDGGVAHCDGCHTMHNSVDGQTVTANPNAFLTKGSDPSSTCLNCHKGSTGSYHILTTDGSNFYPGGDFYWLTKPFTWTTSYGAAKSSQGYDHGHSIVAADFGLTADTNLTQAPGGTYNAQNLACTSCHDPHGKVAGVHPPISGSGSYGGQASAPAGTILGNYRILGDIGYVPPGGTGFTAGPPVAVAPAFSTAETDSNHTDYGQGMSEWCSNCHNGFTGTSLKHPAANGEKLTPTIITNYNQYVATGNMTNTTANSYLALTPFERGTSDTANLSATSTVGPDSNSNVMCLTCHRAHASAFPKATRWDSVEAFPVTESHPAAGDGGVTGDDVNNSYYGRDLVAQFGDYQRSFCNKCHGQD